MLMAIDEAIQCGRDDMTGHMESIMSKIREYAEQIAACV